ncbi:acyl-CoA dehydrogenase family protein [Desulforhabdus amnigena]|jgi:alkylation response protein AidB-like acyl-CoA dehydrogenase|uniref:Acyl-CoA dehydrogenase n=1 Tax=Desulforhabdus amnigena TaxID=40218 RepID=A0A9W6FUF9_9BACT|nr:acyl-CoA dehydrogenase family protein [Desulforhabdus amnigena]NLJ27551.1 acyl-CoA dehydrogenase [Deltaproteobacteria bacterium]GLI35072.1 acyl-CoA dehydrogenase [Desulforhabdus amnigena]
MSNLPKGGSFLLEAATPQSIFTPEDFAEEHRMIESTMVRFLAEKVFPRLEEVDAKKDGLMRELLVEAGELGILGADIPEQYGGAELDEICSTIIAEKVGAAGSFAIAHGGHTGIGNLPIVFFGNELQKEAYLPSIVTAEKIAAYALTEPGSGSDALSAKTKAVLSADGKHYVLNGAKTFISNAGMADIFIVYAKIDGDKFSAFIVDGDSEGLSTGAEERKMGLKGSSTRSVYFDDVKVPVENLLFEAGKGHVVAFNILNIGRHKVAANAVGASKLALDQSANYANERKQFKVPIAQFGLIKEKLAEMAARIYAAESMIYRTGGLLNDMLHSLDRSGPDGGRVTAKGIEEYALECSLEKVFASEVEAFAVDEGVQIHGGYGFIAEYPVERLYRDARIRRIFEGTNEINRNLIPTTLMRRAAKGDLPLLEAVAELRARMGSGIPVRENADDLIQAAKDVFLFALGAAREKHGEDLLKQQEILSRLADLAIWAYGMESSWLRAQKAAANNGHNGAKHKSNMARLFIYDSLEQIARAAREILMSLAVGSEWVELQAQLTSLLQYTPINLISLRREIAAEVSAAGKYIV